MKKVAVLLSGGVDSSYSAYLLQKSGFDIFGIYLILHDNKQKQKFDLQNIEIVKKSLNIDVYTLDLKDKFREFVYSPFIKSYIDGTTPNPCAMCNPSIKFGEAYSFAKSKGANFLATGHYVQCDSSFLYEGSDKNKDQSYFLFGIKKEILKELIFPLGNKIKEDIKKEALKIEFLQKIAKDKESQEICFVEKDYIDILDKEGINIDKKGDVLDKNGTVVGEHKGYMHYTVGKRKGFRVHGAHDPHYVLSSNPENNTISVGTKEQLAKIEVKANRLNMFINELEFSAEVKLRYRSKKSKATIKIEDNIATISLEEPIYGVADNQAAVFYEGEKLLGGGYIISSS